MSKKLLLGAHLSIAGGYQRAIERGEALGCTAVQIFTKNQVQWRAKPITGSDIERYRNAFSQKSSVRIVCAHGSYLYNLASPSRPLVDRSIAGILDEIARCDRLQLPYFVIHPGSHLGEGEERGIERITQALETVLDRYDGATVICLETTAGQGTSIGWRFEHLGRIMQDLKDERMGACLDTCHVFAAGYDVRTREGYLSTMRVFGREVGLSRLKVIHLNDCKGVRGSRLDRHTHIGKGKIGREGFKFFLKDRRLGAVPKIIETPKTYQGREMDGVNLKVLRKLAGGK